MRFSAAAKSDKSPIFTLFLAICHRFVFQNSLKISRNHGNKQDTHCVIIDMNPIKRTSTQMAIQQKNKPADLQDRTERLEKLCQYSEKALFGMTVTELRELCAFLIPGARKLLKPALVQAILDISQPFREEKLKETIAVSQLMGTFDISIEFLHQGFSKGLAPSEVSKVIISKFESGDYTASTIAKTKMAQLRNLLKTLRYENPKTSQWSEELYKSVAEFAKQHHQSVNKGYAKTVEEYGTEETIIRVDGNKILNWAKDTINDAFTKPDLKRGWAKVSFALALTSGRRMSEIHGYTQYTALDENTLQSVGLCKKEDKDYTHVAPCLVNAYIWVAVHNKLPENRRNQETHVVNQHIRKLLEDTLKNILPGLGLHSYKDSRDFYVSYLIATQYNPAIHLSEISYAKKLLGHESKKYTLSYQKMLVEV